MKPIEIFTGNWGVLDGENLIVSGLKSERAAKIWINSRRKMDESTRAVYIFDRAR